VEDLTELFGAGRAVGEQLMPEVVRMLAQSPISYGKGAIVGISGEFEHGGACIHPMLGKPMRAAVGGGKAVIPSNVKVAACGASIDVPLTHKDNSWSFDHFDTMTVSMPDGPKPDEIVVIMAVADGGRLHPRCGTAPR
jgi:Amino acid synthesis